MRKIILLSCLLCITGFLWSDPANAGVFKRLAEYEALKFGTKALIKHEEKRFMEHAAERQGIYSSRKMEKMLESRLKIDPNTGKKEILTSKTLPKHDMPNIVKAGTGSLKDRVYYNDKGLVVFDNVAKHTVRIKNYVPTASSRSHLREATRLLREDINKDPSLKNKFTSEQLDDIKAGRGKITDYTWHHTEDCGVMQLVPTILHRTFLHTGGHSLCQGQ